MDNSSKDYVRLTEGKCVNQKGQCSPYQCSCSADCKEFTWISTDSMLSNQTVRFSMKFLREDTNGGYVKRTAEVICTGTGNLR